MPDKPRRRIGAGPMDEENFPTRSPTRDAVEREMDEPANLRGPTSPTPQRRPPTRDTDEESAA